jgi:hypothetical protein
MVRETPECKMRFWALIVLIPVSLWGAESTELIQRIAKLNWYKTSPAEIQEILQTPDWEATVWDHLTKLAVQARDGSIVQRVIEEAREMERRGEHSSERMMQLQQEMEAARPKITRANKAREEFCQFANGLARLMDPRVVRLLGPFVEEREDSIFGGDYIEHSVRDYVISTISRMAYRGLPLPSPPPKYGGPGDVEKWRQWWATNKEHFGPVLRVPPAKITAEPSPKTAAIAKSEIIAASPTATSQVAATTKPGRQSTKAWILILMGVLSLVALIVFAAKVTRKS